MSESDFVLAVCDRLHDACRAFETSRIFMPEDRRCFGPEAHYVDVLNVLNAALEQPVEARMEAMGMEWSGWSGHRRGRWNEIGRVHDKASIHMDGCIPLYVEVASPSPDLSEGGAK